MWIHGVYSLWKKYILRNAKRKSSYINSESETCFKIEPVFYYVIANESLNFAIITKTFLSITTEASLAQWLEHWSCKPGVESSNLSRGCSLFFFFSKEIPFVFTFCFISI